MGSTSPRCPPLGRSPRSGVGRHRQPERLCSLLRHRELHRHREALRHKCQPRARRPRGRTPTRWAGFLGTPPDPNPAISYGHTLLRGLKRANIKGSLKKDTWSEQRDSNCQSEVQVSGSECQMVAHSDCSKMGILCAGRGAQTQILIRWIVNAETLIAIFIDHPPLLASCCGNSEA